MQPHFIMVYFYKACTYYKLLQLPSIPARFVKAKYQKLRSKAHAFYTQPLGIYFLLYEQ